MNKSIISFVIALLIIGFFQHGMAQTQPPTDEVNVFTGFEPRLAEVEKLTFQPGIQDTFRVVAQLEYPIRSVSAKTTFTPDTIAPARMKAEPLTKLHRLYIKAGFGNYVTPFVDAYVSNLRAKNNYYTFRYKHLSSQGSISNRGNPAMSDNEGYAAYSHYFKTHTLQLNADYIRNVVRYYNYFPALDSLVNEDTARQRYSKFGFHGALFSNYRNDSIHLNHRIDINFYNITDKWGAMENSVIVSADLNKFTDKFAREFFGGKTRLEYIQYQNDSMPSTHGFFANFTPYMKLGGKWWNIHLGVDLALGVDDSTKFNVYPDVQMRFNIYRNYIMIYSTLSGQYRRNSFYALSRQNPYMMSTTGLSNFNEWIHASVGVTGSFTKNFSYNLGASYSLIDNFAYFVNDTISSHQRGFQTVYDRTNRVRIHGELSYNLSDKLWISAKANYYFFFTDKLHTPWHRPSVDATISGYYNLRDKIIIRADFFFIGPQKAQRFIYDAANPLIKNEYIQDIGPLFDISIGGEYRLTKMLSFWVNMNNMAAFRYQRWYGYPTQQFCVMGGLTFGL
ncbi:MAG: hypothetical protein IAE67_08955 [Candidatus Competibacteraceae bacterium]|nr:hypothetical protein [Candidatus Competibacteraceae bacterium]